MTPRRKNADALGDIPEGLARNEYLRVPEEEIVEATQEEMMEEPVVKASRRLAAGIRRQGMDMRDAPAESKRVYAQQALRMAGAIREVNGLDPAAVSMMLILNALLLCDTKEDTEALIGEKVQDTPEGMARVLELYAGIINGWATTEEALNG